MSDDVHVYRHAIYVTNEQSAKNWVTYYTNRDRTNVVIEKTPADDRLAHDYPWRVVYDWTEGDPL